MNLEYVIKPRAIALTLAILSLYLALQSIFGEYINTNVLHGQYNSLPSLILDEFSVNAEQTIPTWYQVILLLSASVLLALIARAKRATQDPDTRYWIVLALIFLYLSIDESAAIHELFSDPLHTALQTSGVLAFGWQIAAAPLLILFGLLFLRFLFHLPTHTRNLFILSGALYIGGAFITDAISANQLPPSGELTLSYLVIGTLEEVLEMAGQVLFLYTLLSYIEEMGYGFDFRWQRNTSKQHLQEESGVSGIAQRDRLVRRIAMVGILIVGVNIALVYWALTQPSASLPTVTNPIPVYQTIIAGFPENGMLVTHMTGLFGSDNLATQNYAATLLSDYHDILVVTVSSVQSTIFIAGDTLPFDRQALSDFLVAQGEVEFIVFDIDAVRRTVGNP